MKNNLLLILLIITLVTPYSSGAKVPKDSFEHAYDKLKQRDSNHERANRLAKKVANGELNLDKYQKALEATRIGSGKTFKRDFLLAQKVAESDISVEDYKKLRKRDNNSKRTFEIAKLIATGKLTLDKYQKALEATRIGSGKTFKRDFQLAQIVAESDISVEDYKKLRKRDNNSERTFGIAKLIATGKLTLDKYQKALEATRIGSGRTFSRDFQLAQIVAESDISVEDYKKLRRRDNNSERTFGIAKLIAAGKFTLDKYQIALEATRIGSGRTFSRDFLLAQKVAESDIRVKDYKKLRRRDNNSERTFKIAKLIAAGKFTLDKYQIALEATRIGSGRTFSRDFQLAQIVAESDIRVKDFKELRRRDNNSERTFEIAKLIAAGKFTLDKYQIALKATGNRGGKTSKRDFLLAKKIAEGDVHVEDFIKAKALGASNDVSFRIAQKAKSCKFNFKIFEQTLNEHRPPNYVLAEAVATNINKSCPSKLIIRDPKREARPRGRVIEDQQESGTRAIPK